MSLSGEVVQLYSPLPEPFLSEAVTEVNDLRVQKSFHLGVGQGAGEPTVYGCNTKVSAPFNLKVVSSASALDPLFHFGTRKENLSCRFLKVMFSIL